MDERWELTPEEINSNLLEYLNMSADKLINPAFRLILNMKYQELYQHVLTKYRSIFGADPLDKRFIHTIVIELMNDDCM